MIRMRALSFLILMFVTFSIHAEEKEGDVNRRGFVIATWNVGHFSGGKKTQSTITYKNIKDKADEFNMVVNDSIKADILCLNEYSTVFGKDAAGKQVETKGIALSDYSQSYEGPLMGFSCNAVYGNLKLKNVKIHEFECVKPFIKKLARAANYYYIMGDLFFNGLKIKIVCAHTISGHATLNSAMNVEIISELDKFDKVIICGDWNCINYKIFEQAGYKLANSGEIKTFPSRSYPLDNIMVKGLNVSNGRAIKTDLSDHYPLVCNISIE